MNIELAFLLMLVTAPADARTAPQTRIERLGNALLAPCCYSEPVSRHRSEVALKMREEIAAEVALGTSDREILDHYKQLYGAHVLIEPEGARAALGIPHPIGGGWCRTLADGCSIVAVARQGEPGAAAVSQAAGTYSAERI